MHRDNVNQPTLADYAILFIVFPVLAGITVLILALTAWLVISFPLIAIAAMIWIASRTSLVRRFRFYQLPASP